MFIHTSSGSIYELNPQLNQVRRLHGNGPPTQRVGDVWKKYVDLEVDMGQSMIIIWSYEGVVAKTTVTSVVTKIEETGMM